MQGHIWKMRPSATAKTVFLSSLKRASLNPIRRASRARKTPDLDPLRPLERLAAVPILEDTDRVFQPTDSDVIQGEELFTATRKNEIKFVLSAPRPEFAPTHNMPEVAFVGRSNVGKSSLIKAIFTKAPDVLVKTSKTPVGKHLMLVDMPGYGYKQPKDFEDSAEAYLATRQNLRITVLLVDSNTGMKDVDMVAVEMLEQFSLPYMIALTKIDRASKHKLLRTAFDTKAVIRNHTSFCLPQPFLVSSHTLDGVAMLKAFIGVTSGVILPSQSTESTNSAR